MKSDTVAEHRHLSRRDLTTPARVLEQDYPAPLEVRPADRVRGDQESRVAPVIADLSPTWPAIALDDRGQPFGILEMDPLHLRVVSIEQRALFQQALPGLDVALLHGHQPTPNVFEGSHRAGTSSGFTISIDGS